MFVMHLEINMKKIFLTLIFLFLALFAVNVKAATASSVLPCDLYNASIINACGDVNSQITSLIKVLLGLVFSI